MYRVRILRRTRTREDILVLVQPKRVSAAGEAGRRHARSYGHIAVEDVEAGYVLDTARPCEELVPDVGELGAVGLDGEDALLLARNKTISSCCFVLY